MTCQDKRQPVYLHMTVAKLVPEMVWQSLQNLKMHSLHSGYPAIQGLRQALLVESQDEPGRLIWLSIWDTLADAQAFLGSPRYARLVAELRAYLLREPEGFGYRILGEIAGDQGQEDRMKGGNTT